jgi:mannose-6-phosphate isomerase-like protein (cupin superfamily)
MTTIERTTTTVLHPDDAETIWEGPIGTTIRVPAARTAGALSVCEMPVAPGYMVPPHTHGSTDEWTYVLAGRIGARVGDTEVDAGPGSWILKPRGVMHTFWNVGPEPARIIELLIPGRFEAFFREMTELAARDALTDERLDALATEYDTTVSMDWVEELASRYGLEVTI